MSTAIGPSIGPLAEQFLAVGGQRIRLQFRPGFGVPLVLCNGIGASFEVLDPLLAALHPKRPVVRFDVPGTGASPHSPLPYGFPYLGWVLGRALTNIGLGVVDILGFSWGGALAQQFAFQNPRRCRRLILAASATGAVAVPGHPRVLAKMLTPRRFQDPEYGASIAGGIYGGTARHTDNHVAELFVRQPHAGSKIGYLHQLTAMAGWTSIHALPTIRQRTLIIAGEDDPIVPLKNAQVMKLLLPRAQLHRHSGGHIDLLINADTLTPAIEAFLGPPREPRMRRGHLGVLLQPSE